MTAERLTPLLPEGYPRPTLCAVPAPEKGRGWTVEVLGPDGSSEHVGWLKSEKDARWAAGELAKTYAHYGWYYGGGPIRLARLSRAARGRLKVVGEALELPASEVQRAGRSEQGLLAFTLRHKQSLDWIILGDPRPMIRERARYLR